MKSDVVWDFVNPYCMPRANDVKALTAADPHYTPKATLYKYRPAGVDGQVFRAWRYSPNFSGFKGKKLKPLGPLNDPKKWNKYFKGFGFGGGISVGGGGAGPQEPAALGPVISYRTRLDVIAAPSGAAYLLMPMSICLLAYDQCHACIRAGVAMLRPFFPE